ncbi:MAG: VWA domain-containing protein [Aggregatilineales bacterium]
MTFANPIALILLVAIPYFAWLGRPRLAYRRRRDWLSLMVRLALALCLIFALAGAQAVRAADRLSVVFLLDDSDSIDAAGRVQAQTYIQDALQHLTPTDRAGLVVFGQNALIERTLSNSTQLGVIGSAPIRLNTNIAGAIRLALAMFPADTARRIVLLSDGDQTQGDALAAAQLAQAAGVQIDSVALPGRTGPDMAVSNVQAPDKVNPGEQFDLSVTVQSQTDGAANLTILAAGSVIKQQLVQVKIGDNHYVFTLSVTTQGFADFQVRLDPAAPDSFYQNKTLSGFTDVVGPPRLLMVTQNPEEIGALLPALQAQGLQVDVIAPGDLPGDLAQIANYKSVILANVPATQISTQRMKVIQSYVRDLGGGLVVIGGPNSYGAGGYFQTPLEETLPVDMRIKDQKRVPKLTMAYVIDRSGSMEEIGPSNVTNLELSKEAARRSIQFLYPQDRAGVLSFDSNPEWLVPIQYVVNQDSMDNLIGTLRPGGGTDIYAAIKEIARTLPGDPSALKHVILLTDGGADPTGIVDMVAQMYQNYGITVTSIGIGNEVPPFMADIAKAGHGIYYNLTDLQNIPQIFAAETVLATHSYIIEKQFNAAQTADSPILNGITGLPPLLGYVATTPKDTASILLTEPNFNDPILASWQYGLGRAVAFTSDATGRWAKNWVSWDQFGRFWSQTVRWTITDSGTGNQLESHVEQRGDQTILVTEARDTNGGFVNGLNLTAHVTDPSLSAQAVQLQQVAPGRYEGVFTPSKEGAYFIRVGGSAGNDPTTAAAQTLGWVLSYSSEYSLRPPNLGLLSDLAQLTNGTLIGEQPDRVFAHDLAAAQSSTAIWPVLLLLATLLLPADIAIRRLIITRRDVDKVVGWAQARVGFNRHISAHTPSARMSRLQNAKARVLPIVESAGLPTVPITRSAPPRHASLTAPENEPVPVQTAPVSSNSANRNTSAPVGDGTLAARLLKERREREKTK